MERSGADGRTAECSDCGRLVDPLLAPARIIAHRVLRLCASCAGQSEPERAEPVPTSQARCRCGAAIDVAQARPTVTTRGIELLCRRCADPNSEPDPAAPPVPEPTAPEPRRLSWRKLVLGVVVVAVAAGAAITLAAASQFGPSAEAMTDLSRERAPHLGVLSVELGDVQWVASPQPPAADELAAPRELDIPGAEDWVHPLVDSEEEYPLGPSRSFGATRPGSRPSECGAGHCGVDLGAARGNPVVAVGRGVVETVVHHGGRRSGKYVRLLHPGGVETYYMHLDDILPGIERGTIVEAGEMLGSMGRTGIQESAPHLHFQVTVPRRWAGRGRSVDPAPALAQARVMSLLEMRIPPSPPGQTSADRHATTKSGEAKTGAAPGKPGGPARRPASLVAKTPPERVDPPGASEQSGVAHTASDLKTAP